MRLLREDPIIFRSPAQHLTKQNQIIDGCGEDVENGRGGDRIGMTAACLDEARTASRR
jgi:hypothetical protein